MIILRLSSDMLSIEYNASIIVKNTCCCNVVSILEGGYNLNALAESTEEHIKALLKF